MIVVIQKGGFDTYYDQETRELFIGAPDVAKMCGDPAALVALTGMHTVKILEGKILIPYGEFVRLLPADIGAAAEKTGDKMRTFGAEWRSQ